MSGPLEPVFGVVLLRAVSFAPTALAAEPAPVQLQGGPLVRSPNDVEVCPHDVSRLRPGVGLRPDRAANQPVAATTGRDTKTAPSLPANRLPVPTPPVDTGR